MRTLLLLAGAAAMISAAPAVTKPGHGSRAMKMHVARVTKAKVPRGKVTRAKVTRAKVVRSRVLTRAQDRNRNGILDADEALARRYGGALCPPGLWKKTPSCVPPGQAKRMFRVGQRVPVQYRYITPYGEIPLVLRDRYDLEPDLRYIYRNNVIYVVDPATNLITRIISAVL